MEFIYNRHNTTRLFYTIYLAKINYVVSTHIVLYLLTEPEIFTLLLLQKRQTLRCIYEKRSLQTIIY